MKSLGLGDLVGLDSVGSYLSNVVIKSPFVVVKSPILGSIRFSLFGFP